jgi:hypothetical protein
MSYKRGLPYVYASESEDKNYIIHFWGEHDESCKDTIWFNNYKDKGIDLDGIKMTMKDLDEIVIKRVEEIINEEFETDKYKKIEKMFNEGKKFRFGKREKNSDRASV